jgi:hypothetical protein
MYHTDGSSRLMVALVVLLFKQIQTVPQFVAVKPLEPLPHSFWLFDGVVSRLMVSLVPFTFRELHLCGLVMLLLPFGSHSLGQQSQSPHLG